ncbi:unnamed protein product [Pleuronectes platessa]|uniref:Uncharacterized protein n=1 Tax=Pleuronectes platessa TaxID=8262 RepID=A0A9N7UUB8_PLEPL|nr:unnamed protein product [Pleuronectes platessa]
MKNSAPDKNRGSNPSREEEKSRTGEEEKSRRGEQENWRTGEQEKRRRGEEENRRRGEQENWRTGEEEKRRRGEEENRRTGEEENRRRGEQENWRTEDVWNVPGHVRQLVGPGRRLPLGPAPLEVLLLGQRTGNHRGLQLSSGSPQQQQRTERQRETAGKKRWLRLLERCPARVSAADEDGDCVCFTSDPLLPLLHPPPSSSSIPILLLFLTHPLHHTGLWGA